MKLVVIGLVLAAVTVLIHCLGMQLSLMCSAALMAGRSNLSWWRVNVVIVSLLAILLITHMVEVLLWAGVYVTWGLLPDMTVAAYFSMTSYSTLGFGDVLLPPPWRMLGPVEALVGVLMLGLSTATIVAILQRAARGHYLKQLEY